MNNRALMKTAAKVLVGGVDSPVRAFVSLGRDPVPFKKGRGAKIFDHDGKSYVDHVLSYGALLLGHSDPFVVRRVREAARNGFSFGATTAAEVDLARRIVQAVPFAEKVRFVNSGTEAVMTALRLARGVTRRTKIIKCDRAYHGHADSLLSRAGSGLATLNISLSEGVPGDSLKNTLIIPHGDTAALERVFRRYAGEIAAVIVEPVGGNDGVIVPDPDFLRKLRQETRRCGALLIFDEVITGFRYHYGPVASLLGVGPDLICLGKIIGGGLPIGAVAGSAALMDHLAPLGKVYQASTFGGNPLVMTAGAATLQKLSLLKGRYPTLSEKAAVLSEILRTESRARGVRLDVVRYASMFSLKFHRRTLFRSFYRRLLDRGIYFAPSEYETNFISFAHTLKDVARAQDAVRGAFKRL